MMYEAFGVYVVTRHNNGNKCRTKHEKRVPERGLTGQPERECHSERKKLLEI